MKGLSQCAAISPGIKGCGLRHLYSPREIEAIEHLSFRFPAPTPFLLRARGTRAPTEAARSASAPYQEVVGRRSRGDRPTEAARSASAPYQVVVGRRSRGDRPTEAAWPESAP